MAKKQSLDNDAPENSGDGGLHITPDTRKAILHIIDETNKVKLSQESLKDDIAAVAAKMGCKPARVKGIVNLVMKEQEKGGVLVEEEQRLTWTREVLEQMEIVQPDA